jgi:membrane protease YdiL (CAAX protease family)
VAGLRSMSAVWAVAVSMTALALVEHTWAPWRPFYVVYAAICVAIPLYAGTARLQWPKLRVWAWIGVLALSFALQLLAGVWLGSVWPAIVSAIGSDPDATSILVVLPSAIARHVDAWGIPPGDLVLRYVVFITIWAGVGEELLYRGYVHEVLRERSGFWSAALVSSAWFAIRHAVQLVGGPEYPWLAATSWVLFGFGLGLVWAWLYERTRSLWPPIIVHTLFNAIPLTQALLASA